MGYKILIAVGLVTGLLTMAQTASAQTPYQGFSFEGELTNSSGAPITGSKTVVFRITDPSGNCLLYEESQSIDFGTNGKISTFVGSSTRTGNDRGLTLGQIFSNSQSSLLIAADPPNCTPGYTPVSGQSRKLQVVVDAVTLSPSLELGSVPNAFNAETLQGRTPFDLLAVRNNGPYELTQTNLENIFTATNRANLMSLLAGTSTQYLSATPSGPVSFSGQVSVTSAPTVGTDATNKNYVDTNIGGRSLSTAAPSPGHVLSYNGSQWISTSVPSDNNKLDTSGGIITGPLSVSGVFTASEGITVSGNVRTINGFSTTPAYSFNGSTSTGLFSPAPNSLALSTNGVQRLTIDSGGKVGIGTNTPVRTLTVKDFLHLEPSTTAPLVPVNGDVYFSTAGYLRTFYAGTWKDLDPGGGGPVNIALPDGNEASPSLTFDSDNDLGMFKVGPNHLGFSVLGQKRMELDQTGKLTVFNPGSLDAAERLFVMGSAQVRSHSGAIANSMVLHNGFGTNNSGAALDYRMGANSVRTARISAIVTRDAVGTESGELVFETTISGVSAPRLKLDDEGRVKVLGSFHANEVVEPNGVNTANFAKANTIVLVNPTPLPLVVVGMQPGGDYTLLVHNNTGSSQTFAFATAGTNCTSQRFSPMNSPTGLYTWSIYRIRFSAGICFIRPEINYNP